MPKVSIIMCAYNAAAYIERAIKSVLNQTYEDWELVIADDASSDDTVAIVQEYLSDKRIKLFQQPENLGYIRNKNFAFSKAAGCLLTQMDADDMCPPERIERQVSIFRYNKNIKICGTNYCLIDIKDKICWRRDYGKDKLLTLSSEDYPFWFPSLMFHKSLIAEFGLFSEYFIGIYGDDNYWTVRVNKRYPIYFINEVLYHYRITPGSLTNVLNDKRKLIVAEIVQKLKKQQINTGTDYLELGYYDKMRAFENGLLTDNKVVGAHLCVWAAKAIDKGEWKQAVQLINKSFLLFPLNANLIRTCFYFIRKRYHHTI